MAGIFDALGFRTETTPNINPLTVDVNPTMDTKVPNSGSVLNLIKATPINSPALRTYGESFYGVNKDINKALICLLYTSPSPRDGLLSRMPSSA